MGIQDVDDVTLIRHAYVRRPAARGVGTRLLAHLVRFADAAGEASAGRHVGGGQVGRALLRASRLRLVTPAEKDRLLRCYWSIPERQVETSVARRFRARRPRPALSRHRRDSVVPSVQWMGRTAPPRRQEVRRDPAHRGCSEGVLAFEAVGEVDAEDYEDVLKPAIEESLAGSDQLRFVFEIGAEFDRFTQQERNGTT